MKTLAEREKHILEGLDVGAYRGSDQPAKARYAEVGARFDDLRAQLLAAGDSPTDEQVQGLHTLGEEVQRAGDGLGIEDPHGHSYVDSEPRGFDWGIVEGVTFPRSGVLLGLAGEDFMDTTWDHDWRASI